MVLFDLAEASWFPLVMVLVIGGLAALLFWSMRREIGKIQVPKRGEFPPEHPSDR